jgi:hypothetical protein
MLKLLALLFSITAAHAAVPVITAPALTTVAQASAKTVAGISIAEAGASPVLSYTVTLTTSSGTLAVTPGSATVTGSGTKLLTVKGTSAQVNPALATLTFTGSVGDQISIATTDANSQVSVPASIAVNVLSSANTYLIYATQALAQARSKTQCTAVGCDGTKTVYWWNVIGPTNAGTISATAIAAGSYALEVQPGGYFGATVSGVGPCAVGCGLSTVEQGSLVTAAQLVTVLP